MTVKAAETRMGGIPVSVPDEVVDLVIALVPRRQAGKGCSATKDSEARLVDIESHVERLRAAGRALAVPSAAEVEVGSKGLLAEDSSCLGLLVVQYSPGRAQHSMVLV